MKRGVAVVLVMVFLLGANSVWAHAQLVKSNPPDKADLKQSPTRVEFWFDELLDNGFNSVVGFSAADSHSRRHVNLAKGDPLVDPKDKTHLIVPLRPLKPGRYVIQYRVLSRDGHIALGQVTFQVQGANF